MQIRRFRKKAHTFKNSSGSIDPSSEWNVPEDLTGLSKEEKVKSRITPELISFASTPPISCSQGCESCSEVTNGEFDPCTNHLSDIEAKTEQLRGLLRRGTQKRREKALGLVSQIAEHYNKLAQHHMTEALGHGARLTSYVRNMLGPHAMYYDAEDSHFTRGTPEYEKLVNDYNFHLRQENKCADSFVLFNDMRESMIQGRSSMDTTFLEHNVPDTLDFDLEDPDSVHNWEKQSHRFFPLELTLRSFTKPNEEGEE